MGEFLAADRAICTFAAQHLGEAKSNLRHAGHGAAAGLLGGSWVAVGQNQWYHFGVGAPPILVYFSGHWDVHSKYGLLTHGQVVSTVDGRNPAPPQGVNHIKLIGRKSLAPNSMLNSTFPRTNVKLGERGVTRMLISVAQDFFRQQ